MSFELIFHKLHGDSIVLRHPKTESIKVVIFSSNKTNLSSIWTLLNIVKELGTICINSLNFLIMYPDLNNVQSSRVEKFVNSSLGCIYFNFNRNKMQIRVEISRIQSMPI